MLKRIFGTPVQPHHPVAVRIRNMEAQEEEEDQVDSLESTGSCSAQAPESMDTGEPLPKKARFSLSWLDKIRAIPQNLMEYTYSSFNKRHPRNTPAVMEPTNSNLSNNPFGNPHPHRPRFDASGDEVQSSSNRTTPSDTDSGSRPPESTGKASSTGMSTTLGTEKIEDILDKMNSITLSDPQILRDYAKFVEESQNAWVEAVEGNVENDIRQLSRLQKRDEIETRRRKLLEVKGTRYVPKPKPKNEFPALPPEAVELCKAAWARSLPHDEVFSEAFSIRVARKDLLTLRGAEWLNDEIINFYLNLVVDRAEKDASFPKTYMFNSFFFETLLKRGYAGVKRWTRKVDIFSYDIILVPIHLTVHWCMAIIDLGEKRIEYYDSLCGDDRIGIPEKLRDYLEAESLDKKNIEFDTSEWQIGQRFDIPLQMNGSDCGVFATHFADFAARRADILFNQSHMDYYRRRMVYEICTKQLM
ncbi:hypothetical protein WR25_23347 [Diploscapter pachys]|uniref:Ubiquitin-like protease family profile domain-containing protein n=1 Tax=Diploscapter pachys TaxID=2018661 RepID=A0A2A2K2D8_9BILA|nr:hypothetical protein WR25_23347 [Diploscapter pachys]